MVNKPKVSQVPEFVHIGAVVELTCTVTFPEGLDKMADEGIQWRYGNATIVNDNNDTVAFGETVKDEAKKEAKRVLNLKAEGDYWPSVLCAVTYMDERNLPMTVFSDIFWINLNGESQWPDSIVKITVAVNLHH